MNTVTDKTEKQVAEDIALMAKQDFAGHVLTNIGPGEWRCVTPGTGISSFTVLCRPHVILVFGDIGDWVLNVSHPTPLNWILGSSRSPRYLFEKVRAAPDEGKHCWYWLDAKADLEKDAAGDERCRKALEDIDDSDWRGDVTQRTFLEACEEHELDDMQDVGVGFTARTYWLYEALRWFSDAYTKQASPGAGAEVAP